MKTISIIGMGTVGVSVSLALINNFPGCEIKVTDKEPMKALGEALDISNASCLLPNCTIEYVPFEELSGGDMTIVCAGVKSRPNETRLALLERNLKTAESICDQLLKNPLPKFIMILTNPVDIITEYFMRRFEKKDVTIFGSGTSLDSLRLRQIIGSKAQVNALNIHAWVVGEHGDSSVCVFSSSTIACTPLTHFPSADRPTFKQNDLVEISQLVRQAASKIISLKGATSHAIGLTTGRIVRAILMNENSILPITNRVSSKLCAGIPSLLNNSGILTAIPFELSQSEFQDYEHSLDILRNACNAL